MAFSSRGKSAMLGVGVQELRFDYIGVNALYHDALSQAITEHWRYVAEVRLRVAARTATRADAEHLSNEVETLYTNGPAGGGGESPLAPCAFVPRSQLHRGPACEKPSPSPPLPFNVPCRSQDCQR